jgi:hypothetical protein
MLVFFSDAVIEATKCRIMILYVYIYAYGPRMQCNIAMKTQNNILFLGRIIKNVWKFTFSPSSASNLNLSRRMQSRVKGSHTLCSGCDFRYTYLPTPSTQYYYMCTCEHFLSLCICAVSLAVQLARPLLGTMPGVQAACLLLKSKSCHQEITGRSGRYLIWRADSSFAPQIPRKPKKFCQDCLRLGLDMNYGFPEHETWALFALLQGTVVTGMWQVNLDMRKKKQTDLVSRTGTILSREHDNFVLLGYGLFYGREELCLYGHKFDFWEESLLSFKWSGALLKMF